MAPALPKSKTSSCCCQGAAQVPWFSGCSLLHNFNYHSMDSTKQHFRPGPASSSSPVTSGLTVHHWAFHANDLFPGNLVFPHLLSLDIQALHTNWNILYLLLNDIQTYKHTWNQNILNCTVYGNTDGQQSKFITTGKQWILSRQLAQEPYQNLKIVSGDFKRSTSTFMETVQSASEQKSIKAYVR